jgi:AhpD family alkylhydroperoxidase
MSHPRIETPKEHRFPWYVRLFFWNQKRRYGAVLEPARLWGRTPRVFVALALLYGALDRRSSPLEPALRTLVTVRVSQINWCPFCVDINSATALKRGIGAEKLLLLSSFAESDCYSESEKAVLSYAEAVTRTDLQPTDEHFRRLREHFDDDAIIELTALIAFQNLSSKFNAALSVAAPRVLRHCTAAPASARNPASPARRTDPPRRAISPAPA